MSTILVPLSSGSIYGNHELRLCLGSIRKFATGYDEIVIVGEDPRIDVGDARTIPFREVQGPKAARIAWKIMGALRHIDDDDILLWADDYVMLRQFDLACLKTQHLGALRARAAARRGQYQATLLSTAITMEMSGYSSWDYDAHLPMRISKRAFIELTPWWERSLNHQFGLLVKSVYGNVLGIAAEFAADCKVYSLADLKAKGEWICSLPERCNEVIDYLTKTILRDVPR